MTLYFLRHGIATDASRDGDDASRPLTSEGRDRMRREAKTMKALDLDLDAILTSPLRRARETAEIVAGEVKVQVVEDPRLGPAFNLEQLEAIIQGHRDKDALMLVGHEPTFSATIGRLIGDAALDVKKGSLARVDLTAAQPPRGELVWLIPPKLLAR